MVRAYNDWHIDEWAGTYPGRFIPLRVLPMLWDRRGSPLPRCAVSPLGAATR